MDDSRPGGRTFDRLITFSDAVVAIAMTLLVLPLVDLPSDVVGGANIGQVLAGAHNQLIAFAVSFLVIWRLWLTHHRVFEHYRTADSATGFLNIVWLATIVVLPFPTALLSTPVSEHGAVPLYVSVLLLSTLMLQAMAWRVRHHAELAETGAGSRSWLAARPEWTMPGSMALALILSLVLPKIGPWVMVLLFLPPMVSRFAAGVRRIARRHASHGRPHGEAETGRQPAGPAQ